ncbi:hypothetical protein [Clostridium formicaceticum]|uniref:Uncharacterized protein n=1 Tax=Clostridium formicaceticum TaxID=1497 RepID=A0AAC9RMP6_9CLOT|nr:hypothetical protein [Clostridium formicaceticum]AOY76692.1 hypothetical protein BJL90_12940 [Clostridium formicaceticum]ARE87125.1 hypothetical protein CLFO_15110 [Clostridium formicaceticum]
MAQTPNYSLKKPAGNEYYDVQIQNDNMDIIDQKMKENATAINTHLAEHIQIVVTEENIPVGEREKGAFYFVATDKAPIATTENIKVSPTMGLKIE